MGWIAPIKIVDKYNRYIDLRTAEGKDAENILEYNRTVISSEAHLLTVPEEFTLTVEQERSWIEQMRGNDNNLVIIAEDQGRIVGFLDFKSGRKRRIAHTGSFGMSVHGDYQGGGIGKALLQALIEWAGKHPRLEKISLEVFATNVKAIELYTKMGFIRESLLRRQIKLQDGHYVDVIGMGLLLPEK
ncbi:GNAT family N-acetyltransferase [Paenibacillus sanfengchensis]|uniref:GNAT family N-acetyltransferase n=1 Tax=Paenibacillus sanfengchensis TaxID=3119819 RepID=UPI002FE2482C